MTGMTARARTSKISLGLAGGATAALAAAAATGHDLTAPEAAGALGVAGVIAVLQVRSNRPRVEPHVLSDVPVTSGRAFISAPQARSMAAHPAGTARTQSDAA